MELNGLHFLPALIVSGAILVVMVVVSLFTKEIPRDELGGLTWSTIDEPPLAQSPTDMDEAERARASHEAMSENPTSHENGVALEDSVKTEVELVQYHKTKGKLFDLNKLLTLIVNSRAKRRSWRGGSL